MTKMILNKNYWENQYSKEDPRWDTGSVTTPIKEYIDQLQDKSLKILVPGAGNGYEFEYLLSCGFKNSFVIDIVKAPLENIKNRIPFVQESQLIHCDFFDHQGEYDLILEQTFFCSIPKEQRIDYAKKMKSLLNPNGKLVGLLFQCYFLKNKPPFGGSKQEYKSLFEKYFTIRALKTAYNSIKPRKENELFFIFEQK